MPTLDVFGAPIIRAEIVAEAKFKDLPWQFFDGVPDRFPNRLVPGDFAITRVINSRIGLEDTNSAITAWKAQGRGGDAILERVSCRVAIQDLDDNSAVFDLVRVLFLRLRVEGRLSMSKISKVLCRKRPNLVPMLDNVVTRQCLLPVARRWVKESEARPPWFLKRWNAWDDQARPEDPSLYLRMVRDSVNANRASLREIRQHLVGRPETGVTPNASLLRIWEAIVYWKHR